MRLLLLIVDLYDKVTKSIGISLASVVLRPFKNFYKTEYVIDTYIRVFLQQNFFPYQLG